MHRAFPEAPIFTTVYFPESTFDEFRQCTIRTSWFQNIVKNETQYKKLLLPFGILAIRSFNFSDFDVVLLNTTHCAKYIKISPRQFVIAYCHTPFRLLWSEGTYRLQQNGFLNKVLLRLLRNLDAVFAKRIDRYITNSEVVRGRIQKCYQPEREIHVLPPPVHLLATGSACWQSGDYYLVVSRLEYYKRIDLAVQACMELGRKLVVIGNGTIEKEIFKSQHPLVVHVKSISEQELVRYYSECKAVIFPQLEDYGIVPLEANAVGKPVIAYGEGGVRETMIPYTGDSMKSTAVFFEKQTVECLKIAILEFEKLTFDHVFIQTYSKKFDENQFVINLKSFVTSSYANRNK
jgi:glycosyltransferase involved in cell wall biosynthesis